MTASNFNWAVDSLPGQTVYPYEIQLPGTVTVELGMWQGFPCLWEVAMTTSEEKMLWRGVAAGTLIGLAVGGMIALFIAVRPELFTALIP